MNRRELRIAGALLYECEGTKLRKDPRYKNTYIYAIEFTNSNPVLVSLFLRFMQEELEIGIKEIKGQLFLYPDMDVQKVIREWSRRTGIPRSQFQKIIMLKTKVSKFKPNPLGTFKVRFSGKEKFLKLSSIVEKVWQDASVKAT